MTISLKVVWALLALTAVGCGGSGSYEERQAALAKAKAASAVTVGKTEPSSACKLIGAQQATDPKMYTPFANFGANSDDALQNLRQKAVDRGANYVVLDFVAGPMANGRLYACPEGAIPDPGAPPGAAPAAPPAQAACKPDCSPGYACVSGACVSACNPPCGAGKQCGADRTCH